MSEKDSCGPSDRPQKPVSSSTAGVRQACSIHHRVAVATPNKARDSAT